MPRKGGKRVKNRTHHKVEVTGATVLESGVQRKLNEDSVPMSIVARSNAVVAQVGELIHDLRKLMSPHTAMNLKEKKSNRMKDYAAVSSQLGVTHLLTISQTKQNVVLRVGKSPSGPTLHFRVTDYSLAGTVRAQQKRPHENPTVYMTPPLVVLNNFGKAEEQHVKLMKVTFQHMFPSINVKTVKLAECRRVVLFNLRKEDGQVEMRHYSVAATPVGLNKNLKRIISGRLPNLSNLKDVSEFLTGQTTTGTGGVYPQSDSEAEDEYAHVTLSQKFVGRGNQNQQKSAMKLVELGPRMTLELFKVERGLCEGDILYHKDKFKTEAEAAKTKAKLDTSIALKEQRKAIQAQNVEKKKAALEEKKANKKRRINPYTRGKGDDSGSGSGSEGEGGDSDDDDDEEEDGIGNKRGRARARDSDNVDDDDDEDGGSIDAADLESESEKEEEEEDEEEEDEEEEDEEEEDEEEEEEEEDE